MCHGMSGAAIKTWGPKTSATRWHISLLLILAVVTTAHGSGCVRPYMVQNSWVNLTDTNRGSVPVGTVLQYTCDPGYLADGPSTITCSPPGLWSADAPRCIRSDVCLPPLEPENGGYSCHPAPCRRLTHGTVIEFFCDEGFILKGDYKYLTCQDGGWDGPMQISCLLDQDHNPALPLGMPTLSIVASTASSVALLLLLVVLFVLLQPKLKSFHHSRREQGVSGQPVSIMVEGVQVTLPSYEEAVCGGGGGGASTPASAGLISEGRVQIVLSEGQPDIRTPGPPCFSQHSEMVVVHPAPSSPSCWLEQAASPSSPPPLRRLSSGSEQHSLPLLEADMDFSDDMPLLKEV